MDAEAEKLLDDTLRQMAQDLAGSDFCVVLGGSYARGEGGVRKEREKGLLFNDLDFFVFTEKSPMPDEKILRELSEKYHALLHVDVDFSRPADCRSLKKNARRLMMQELKRNYVPVYGKDLLAEHLPELPAELLPFEEACRLLLNRGMALRLASEKLAQNSADGDFILRNISKAVLGAGDALLINRGLYRWQIDRRVEEVGKLDIPQTWKNLYTQAVEYKKTPHGLLDENTLELWKNAARFLQAALLKSAETQDPRQLTRALYLKCRRKRETSLLNLIKYCLKTRSAVFSLKYSSPAVVLLLEDLFKELSSGPKVLDRNGKLFRQWQIFN